MERLLASGDTALVIEFGTTIDREVNARVIALADRIAEAAIPGVVELVPTFRSLMVHYDPLVVGFGELGNAVRRLMDGDAVAAPTHRLWMLPTCYGGDVGPDLDEVAAAAGLTTGEVMDAHARETYRVYCIGFLPGYPYMGDIDARLALPRREVPRVRVPMGSVCIAQRMTGIYPLESPGGWHLLGRTPVRMFDPRRKEAVLLSPGDEVRFVPIPRADYDRLEAAAQAGTLDIRPEARSA